MTNDGKYAIIEIMRKSSKTISWVKAAWKEVETFPLDVQIDIRTALTIVAEGNIPDSAKPLKGLGSGVYEIVMRHQTDAYRAIYAVQIYNEIWVIHAFKKKSKSGIKSNKQDIDLIRDRIKRIKEMYK